MVLINITTWTKIYLPFNVALNGAGVWLASCLIPDTDELVFFLFIVGAVDLKAKCLAFPLSFLDEAFLPTSIWEHYKSERDNQKNYCISISEWSSPYDVQQVRVNLNHLWDLHSLLLQLPTVPAMCCSCCLSFYKRLMMPLPLATTKNYCQQFAVCQLTR